MASRYSVTPEETGPDNPSQDELDTETRTSSNQDLPSNKSSDDSRPEWLPEKFKSPEDMAKAYSELEKKVGSGSGPSEQSENSGDNNDSDSNNEQTAREELESRGLDFDRYSQAFAESGELSDEHYEELSRAGIPKEMVDQFIAGQQAQVQLFESQAMSEFGGEEQSKTVLAWAGDNLSASEVEDFNEIMNGTDADKAMSAIRNLKARYEAANGREPQTMHGGSRTQAAGDVYNDISEVTQDMSDPRYKTSPAFREAVKQKLARSDRV